MIKPSIFRGFHASSDRVECLRYQIGRILAGSSAIQHSIQQDLPACVMNKEHGSRTMPMKPREQNHLPGVRTPKDLLWVSWSHDLLVSLDISNSSKTNELIAAYMHCLELVHKLEGNKRSTNRLLSTDAIPVSRYYPNS